MTKKKTSKPPAKKPKKAAKPEKAVDAKSSPIGKGKPPAHTRFTKGRSGNPKGRPKGSKNLSTIIMKAAEDTVVATIDGRQRKISKLTASAMQLATKAAGGDPKALALFLDRIDEIEQRAAANKPADFPFTLSDLDVLYEVHQRMRLSVAPDEA
jgi:Family of unknown function (DUF5681)